MANKVTQSNQSRTAMPDGRNGGIMMPAGKSNLPAIKMPDLPVLPETLPQITQVMQVFGEQMVQHGLESVEGCAATVTFKWILDIELED